MKKDLGALPLFIIAVILLILGYSSPTDSFLGSLSILVGFGFLAFSAIAFFRNKSKKRQQTK